MSTRAHPSASDDLVEMNPTAGCAAAGGRMSPPVGPFRKPRR